jgi:hypothetical protein
VTRTDARIMMRRPDDEDLAILALLLIGAAAMLYAVLADGSDKVNERRPIYYPKGQVG